MRVWFTVLGLLCAASVVTAGVVVTRTVDPEQVGVAASTERLASVRAAAPTVDGPCDPGALCTANVGCATDPDTGACTNAGAACTSGAVTGRVKNKTCKGTDNTIRCTPITLQGCALTSVGCQTTANSCACTRALATPVAVGAYSGC